MAPLRWGIASAGRISNDFCAALSSCSAEHHQVVAVAARSLSSAQEFAERFNIPKYYDGYEKLASDDEVGMKSFYSLTRSRVHSGSFVTRENAMLIK